ncbi:MAG TPA: hypothetical protein VFN19_09240 [Candidatus Nanopelagicales bacterium]|nr:hypothetical protein [Candidatus Nanopelagicales bacterium]
MATWEDGPEYAPLERPDAFAEPSVTTVGLEPPPPQPSIPEAPVARPAFADPAQAVPPLAALVPEPPDGRDPEQPFAVASSAVTAESSAWASAHWSQPPADWAQPPAPAPQLPISITPGPRHGGVFDRPSWPGSPNGTSPNGGYQPSGAYQPSVDRPRIDRPSVGQPWIEPANPTSQPFPPPAYPPDGGPFPAPGTPQWFGPAGRQPPAPQPAPPTARSVLAAATPGVLLTLAVGAIISVLAPVMVVVAFLLTTRMTYGRKATQIAFVAVSSFLGLVALLALITADGVFADWWSTVAAWACFGSWVLLVASLVVVYRAVKLGRPDQPRMPRLPPR